MINHPELLLERELGNLLRSTPGTMVATAESCTGGSIARRITSIEGSSDYFVGGIVSYSNQIKHRLLGVPEDILENPGAVSESVARAMAEGACRELGAAYSVSTTGIAGPGGGSARKPVGLVYIGQSGPAGTIVERHEFSGSRLNVIEAATQRALHMLLNAIRRAQ
ncbi:MAG: CinA family protein [Thermomicrobiales bacterium]